MLIRLLLPAVLLFSGFAYGQDFTRPDSAAVIRNKVKSVSVYLTRKNQQHSLHSEFFYTTSGQMEREAKIGEMSISYFYDTQGRANKSVYRQYNGATIQTNQFEYTKGGKFARHLMYVNNDTIYPSYVFNLDSTTGRSIQTESYISGKLINYRKTKYDDKNEPVWTYDSLVGKQIQEHRNKQLIRYTALSQQGERLQHWTFSYNKEQLITGASFKSPGGKPVKYTIQYTVPPYTYRVMAAGQGVDTAAAVHQFKTDFGYLLPRVNLEGNDEAVEEIVETSIEPKHNLIYDSKGNIIRDEINYPPGSENRNRVYEYEYTFY